MNPSNDASVNQEPHLQGPSKANPDRNDKGVDLAPGLDFRPPVFSTANDTDVDHTVWDEPGVGGLNGKPTADALTYANWLTQKISEWNESKAWLVTLGISLLAGPWAIIAIFVGGCATPGVTNFLLTCAFAPLIIEICKIAIPLWVIEKRPYYFTGWFQIFLCTVASAVVFVTVYNLVAHYFYPPETQFELIFDWSVFLTMHLLTAFLSAIGMELAWRRAIVRKEPPRLEKSYRWFFSAYLIHAIFATVMFALQFVDAAMKL